MSCHNYRDLDGRFHGIPFHTVQHYVIYGLHGAPAAASLKVLLDMMTSAAEEVWLEVMTDAGQVMLEGEAALAFLRDYDEFTKAAPHQN